MSKNAWMAATLVLCLGLLGSGSGPSAQQPGYRPPAHTKPLPLLNLSPEAAQLYADGGAVIERDRPPADDLADHRRIDRALATLIPQRKGVVDVYVVAVGLDSDPVFGREAREAGRVLERRYGAVGRTLVLAGSDGSAPSLLPRASPANLAIVLARIAELIDRREDVVLLYSTSHGAPMGIVYNDGDQGFGIMSPGRLADIFEGLGLKRRIVIIGACYAGGFATALAGDDSVVLTASAADRTSFGCEADNDWTFFGDALVNHALRSPQPLSVAAADAAAQVAAWEVQHRLTPSQPQRSFGRHVAAWLGPIEARIPKAETAPVGRPATVLFGKE